MCWTSSGPSVADGVGVGVAGGGWAAVSSRRFSSLWRSGSTSKVEGGGRPGEDETGAGRAEAELMGGTEARAETEAWGVGAADILCTCCFKFSSDRASVMVRLLEYAG